MFGVFLLLMAVLATAFWGLFAYQNLTLMFGLDSLGHFLPSEQAFLAVSVASPILFIWTFVAWRRTRRQLRQLDMNLQAQGRQAAYQNEETFFQAEDEAGYDAAAVSGAAVSGYETAAVPPADRPAEANETLDADGWNEPGTPLESHRYREDANAARARVAPSIELPKPIEDEVEETLNDPYGYAGKGERTHAGEGGAPPSVLGGNVSLDDLIREKNEQDAREANKWEIDPEHPFADNVPTGNPEPTKVSLSQVIAEEQAEERAIERQVSSSHQSQTTAAAQPGIQPGAQPRVQPDAQPSEGAAQTTETEIQEAVVVQPTADPGMSPAPASTPESRPSPAAEAPAAGARVPPAAPVLTAAPAFEESEDVDISTLKLPPHPFEVQAEAPQSLSPEQLANLERRVRGELNSIAMDLASVISAPERYDHAFQHYNGGAQDAFFQLVSEDLIRGQGPQMNQQLRLLGGEAMLKSFVEKYQHLLSTAKLSDSSGHSTHRLSHSGMGEVCRALLESQKQGASH